MAAPAAAAAALAPAPFSTVRRLTPAAASRNLSIAASRAARSSAVPRSAARSAAALYIWSISRVFALVCARRSARIPVTSSTGTPVATDSSPAACASRSRYGEPGVK